MVGADLAHPSWSEALLETGYESREPSVWLAEGLLLYISEAAVRGLFDRAGVLATSGSLLGVDLVNEDFLASPLMRPLLRALARRGAPVHFGTNDPEVRLTEPGWEAKVTQPGERGANYGRWPYPVAPRRVPGVPRVFFMQARRVVQ